AAEVRGESAPAQNAFIQWNVGRNDENGKATGDGDSGKAATDVESKRAARECSRAIVTPDGWKMSLSDNDRCLLYNRNGDPGEQHNLFYRGGHQDVIRRLSSEIHAWQKRTKDPLGV